MEESSTAAAVTSLAKKGVKRQKRKSLESSSGKANDYTDAPNKGYAGVRWRRYPYGVRFVPRVRVPKTRYDLPLGEYRTCEEAAAVRDVAAFYYGKKGAFNFSSDYPSFLPAISPDLSGQEKINWVSRLAKERAKTLFAKPCAPPSHGALVSSNVFVAAPSAVTLSASDNCRKSWPAALVTTGELSAVPNHGATMALHPDFWNLPHHHQHHHHHQ